jgi:hypothetical protein
VVIVEDRDDPFSVDLAGCFHRAVDAAVPDAEIVLKSLATGISWSRSAGPGDDELAVAIHREAEARPAGEPTWVFLPRQDEPTRRLLTALRRHAGPKSPIRVFCGDAIGAADLAEFVGSCPFPIRSLSSTSSELLGPEVSPNALIPAEIVAALVLALEGTSAPGLDAKALRHALAQLNRDVHEGGTLGRSLAFKKSGERVGDDLGQILMTQPGQAGVFATARGADGRWSSPSPVEVQPRTVRP